VVAVMLLGHPRDRPEALPGTAAGIVHGLNGPEEALESACESYSRRNAEPDSEPSPESADEFDRGEWKARGRARVFEWPCTSSLPTLALTTQSR